MLTEESSRLHESESMKWNSLSQISHSNLTERHNAATHGQVQSFHYIEVTVEVVLQLCKTVMGKKNNHHG